MFYKLSIMPHAKVKASPWPGGRHAMGAQQLGTNTLHLDTRPLRRILHFDSRAGLLEVEAGIQWLELVDAYLAIHAHSQPQWGLIQK